MNDKNSTMQGPVCPLPISQRNKIVLSHGSGGKMSQDLINSMFLPPFDNPTLRAGNDAGVVQIPNIQKQANEGLIVDRLAISTDSHVVWPLFFPGGDIGRLAVCGTVNDVSMMGAKPLCLTAGFILEEGLDFGILEEIVNSMKIAADEARIFIVAGDTKVVDKGKADCVFINTSGIGIIPPEIEINGGNAQPGDIVIISGTIGDHGIAVLEARQELGFTSKIQSDIAPLNDLVEVMLKTSKNIHVLRDPTRGGLATSLNEIARQSHLGILLNEESIPVKPAVSAACEMLGFDPMYIPNEGKLIALVSPEDADAILEKMQSTRYGQDAAIIGKVISEPPGRVLMKTMIGSTRVVDVLAGELLPRIC
jgi:hydrogenase expression/formation protein HypE